MVYPLIQYMYVIHGCNIWYDSGIEPDAKWEHTLYSRVGASRQIVCFVTNASMASEYVAKELHWAMQMRKPILFVCLHGKTTHQYLNYQFGTTIPITTTSASECSEYICRYLSHCKSADAQSLERMRKANARRTQAELARMEQQAEDYLNQIRQNLYNSTAQINRSTDFEVRQYRIILSAILRSQIFRQTQQKTESILWCKHLNRKRFKWTSIFVKYDGKDASKIVLKRLRVNCAVLP